MELVVQPLNQTFHVSVGDNLLKTLRDNNVPLSYSCMSGRCGTCRCRVIEGDVLDMGSAAKITNPNEGRYVLACMSVLTGSCSIEIPEPDEIVTHPARIVKATVLEIEDMTHDIKRLLLRPSKPLAFSPGQYAMLQFAPEYSRPYSMAGITDDENLEFHVRLVQDGRVTGYIANQLKIGDAVRVSGPLGTAYLRKKHEGPMLCIAGGTGLAPVLSILRGALAEGMPNAIHVYFGVRTKQDIYGAQWLTAIEAAYPTVHIHIVISNGDNAGFRAGLVTDAVNQDWPSLKDWRAYLCGAPPMVEAAAFLMRQKGVSPEHIHADAFYASAA
jgi:ferredoxin-NAD(P)+ reductase (naphthalene dioxygenase ferredoxin-specific)